MDEFKVLMVDDDEVIAQSTAEYFNMFDVKTAYVTSFEEAVTFLSRHEVSLLLLDINLGDKSGFDLCKKVREDFDMPIFFISARTSDDDVLIALNIGGDDYIKKPYALNVLLAKVKTTLLRYEKAKEAVKEQSKTPAKITDEVSLDVNSYSLKRGNETVSLKAMEFKLLKYLLENSGRVVTKDELLSEVWGDEFVGEGTLAVHVRHLREKIEKDSNNPEIIKTIWGVGYMIDASAIGR